MNNNAPSLDRSSAHFIARLIYVLVLVGLIAACGGGGDGPPDLGPPSPVPSNDDTVIQFSVSPQVINERQSTLLTWNATEVPNADSVEITPDIGIVAL